MPEEKKGSKSNGRNTRVLGVPGGKIVMQIDLRGILEEIISEALGEAPPIKEGKVVPLPTAKPPRKD